MSAAEESMDPALQAGEHLGPALHALVERELSPDAEASARAHLASCSDCSAQHARLESTVRTLRGYGRAAAPAGFAARVLRRVRSAQRKANPLSVEYKVPFEGGILLLIVAAAAAAIVGWQVVASTKYVASSKVPTPDSAPQ